MVLSFIIPLYNCATSIGHCLESIFALDIAADDFEVIVVDDGSKDNGVAIVRRIAEEHPQVRLVSQPNRGASSARNHGLELARGEYIWFVDADDQILSSLKPMELIHQHHDADIIGFNFIRLTSDGQQEMNVIYEKGKTLTGIEQMRTYNLYLWNKLFKRSAIGEIRFVDGTVNQEDMFFCLQVLAKVERVQGIAQYGYLYDCTSNTSTTRDHSLRHYVKNYQDSVLIQGKIKLLADTTEDKPLKRQLMEVDNCCVINHFYIIFRRYGYNRLKKAIKDYSRLGLYPLGKCAFRKQSMFRLFANCKGIFLFMGYLLSILKNKK